jgi:LuxR family maltose regulon positive regulatory protein
VKQGLDYLPWWGKADDLCLAYITLARIQLAQGDRTEAAGAIEKAAQLVKTCGIFSEARNVVEAAQIKMWLAQGDWSAVDRWAATLEKRFVVRDPFRFEDELAHITQARVLIIQNKPDEAIRLLSSLEESAKSSGRQGRLIEILILKASALQKMGNNAHADSTLTKSLELAEPEGYIRIFLDEGRPIRLLIADCRQVLGGVEGLKIEKSGQERLLDYIDLLLRAFSEMERNDEKRQRIISQQSSFTNLVEPLSQRELEVLQLMALGRTNQEIARELIVSRGTVKAHTASIYRKLDVSNRTEAAARARQVGILP